MTLTAQKHKFKRLGKYAYICMSKCEKCGLKREKLNNGEYLFGDSQTKNDPGCLTENKYIPYGIIRS